ncbi:MAG: hypothetical protein CMJ85_11310 [Planctomycetes bacterium]|nr:hypothetical protein [Planctomycetota bacterium]MDP6424357.1 hypothetical protein [Planctomycetota bacterium]
MAHFWILLRLRIKLGLRRYSGRKGLMILTGLALLFWLGFSLWMSLVVASLHEHSLAPRASQTLFDLTALGATVLLVLSPLLGFRSNEFMDVSKLFAYPVRPTAVFLSTIAGNFVSGTAVLLLPILLIPAVSVQTTPAGALSAGLITLLFAFIVFCTTQCITLLLLNLLASRRLSELLAILAPVVGLGLYASMRFLLLGEGGMERSLQNITAFLDGVQLDHLVSFLPPLWYSRALPPGAEAWRGATALFLVGLALTLTGVRLTYNAFHGEIAMTTTEATAKRRRSLISALAGRLLPHGVAAIHKKEMLVLRREPWFKVLFLQQIGLVLFVGLGSTLWGTSNESTGFYGAAALLVFMQSGFLLNSLGLEGSGFTQTAALPLKGRTILSGKNLAQLEILGIVNLLLVPGLAAATSWLSGESIPIIDVAMITLIDVVVLPAVLGSSNLISVLFPARVGQRGRRALGQDRTGNEGCVGSVARLIFSFVAVIPASLVALVIAWPVWLSGSVPNPLALTLAALIGLAVSVAFWLTLTHLASKHLERTMQETLAKVCP